GPVYTPPGTVMTAPDNAPSMAACRGLGGPPAANAFSDAGANSKFAMAATRTAPNHFLIDDLREAEASSRIVRGEYIGAQFPPHSLGSQVDCLQPSDSVSSTGRRGAIRRWRRIHLAFLSARLSETEGVRATKDQ